jgi:hypothetical protein
MNDGSILLLTVPRLQHASVKISVLEFLVALVADNIVKGAGYPRPSGKLKKILKET